MDAVIIAGIAASVCAFTCAYAAVLAVSASMRSRRVALAAQGDALSPGALLRWRLRNGYAMLLPVVSYAIRIKPVHRFAVGLVELCSERGWATSPQKALSVVTAASLLISCVAGVALGSVVSAVAVGICSLALVAAVLGNMRDKREEAVRNAVPEALESMTVCFGSGFTLLQTFRQVASDTPGPLGVTFARCAHVLEMGGDASQALREMRVGAHASELAFVAVALDVQHQSGGAMRQVLDAAAETVKSEIELRRTLRVQTAQARLSARIVVVMPFILIAAFSLASPDFLTPFFTSVFGYALLGVALVMQAAGVVLVRRALEVEGVS